MELEDVFRAYERPVYAYFLRMASDPVEAEELTQETFYRACIAALRFRGESSTRTWLFGIARRVFLERLRTRKRVQPVAAIAEPEPAPTDPGDSIALEQAFQALKIEDREVLMLVDVLGFDPGEAAETLGLAPGTLRVRLHRARQRMKERLSV